MNDVPDKRWLDRKALEYLDALNAGDLERVAALWEEASVNGTLEQALAELDAELAAEEERRQFVAGQSAPSPTRRSRSWIARVAVSACVAAAVFLVWFALAGWQHLPGHKPAGNPQSPVLQVAVRPTNFALHRARLELDPLDLPEFVWPLLAEAPFNTSVPLRADLLD